MTIFEAIVIAVVEGITEFLPISSTGHMIITEAMLGMNIDEFTKAFTVNIQFGAILSVVVSPNTNAVSSPLIVMVRSSVGCCTSR